MKRGLKLKTICVCPEKRKNAGGTPALRGFSEKGSVLVESAVTIVLLLAMLFGIIDFGRALYTYHFVANAAREATRWAAVNGATCGRSCNGTPPMSSGPANQIDVQEYVASLTPPGISSANIQGCNLSNTPDAMGVCTKWSSAPRLPDTPAACAGSPKNPGCPVQVTVSYNFNFLTPIVHRGSITLSSSSETIISH